MQTSRYRLPHCTGTGFPAQRTRFVLILLFATITATAQESRFGYWLPPGDTLRILLVYAELANDPDEPGTLNGWEPGKLPGNPDYFFDHSLAPDRAPRGVVTTYFYQASFGRYIVLADYYPDLISIDYEQARGNGFEQALRALLSGTGDDIVTANGYSVNRGDFDQLSTADRYGQPKVHRPDSMVDMLMLIWRVNSRMSRSSSAGYCVPAIRRQAFKAMKGMNSYSTFINKGAANYVILRHEFSHLLLGGNNFHTGGAGGGTKTFLSSAGGYAMLSSWDRCSQVYNGFDRRRLGWKPPENKYQISALSPSDGGEVNSDLIYGQKFEHGNNEFILRDFVSTGDAVRIRLPYLDNDSSPVNGQWLWLENHQQLPGNLDHSGVFSRGVSAYIQVDKEALSGPATFRGNGNYTWPLSAFGNYDYQIDEKSGTARIADSLANPFTGYNNLIFGAYDLGEKDGVIHRNELFQILNLEVNGEFLDSSVYSIGTYPLFGTAMDAFRAGDRIAIDENPAAVPVLTYYTSSSNRISPVDPRPYDNRSIHLNGICIEFLEELPDGSMRIRVRWDERNIRSRVRWCGDIHLDEAFRLGRKEVILVDRGLTPQKPKDPADFNGREIFTDPSLITLEPGSGLMLNRRSTLILDHSSSMILKSGSRLELKRHARIIVRDSCSFRALEGSIISGRGNIISEPGGTLDLKGGDKSSKIRLQTAK